MYLGFTVAFQNAGERPQYGRLERMYTGWNKHDDSVGGKYGAKIMLWNVYHSPRLD